MLYLQYNIHILLYEQRLYDQSGHTLASVPTPEGVPACRPAQPKEMAEKSGVGLTTISHLEQGVARNITLNNFISLLRVVGMEQRLKDVLPELPMPPMALKQVNKFIPKRVRRNNDDTES